jgi:NADPH-dependent curcumin reductase CurA
MIEARSLRKCCSIDDGYPDQNNFNITTEQVNVSNHELKNGELVVQLLEISADPFQRAMIKSSGIPEGEV